MLARGEVIFGRVNKRHTEIKQQVDDQWAGVFRQKHLRELKTKSDSVETFCGERIFYRNNLHCCQNQYMYCKTFEYIITILKVFFFAWN